MNNKSSYFFIFSLGPVQSYIAQARKAQDLYLGCQLLSDYCRYAMNCFIEKGGKIIFPSHTGIAVPNRFVGHIELASEDRKEVGEAIADKVKERFVREGLVAIQAGLGNFDLKTNKIIGLEDQLNAHLETYWVFTPYLQSAREYKEKFAQAEQIFGMSKSLRKPRVLDYQTQLGIYEDYFGDDFSGETGRKCLVDGENNVKIYRRSTGDTRRYPNSLDLINKKLFLDNEYEVVLVEDNQTSTKFSVPIKQVPPKFIQDGEGLSAISFFKRCYQRDVGTSTWEDKYKDKSSFYQRIEFPSTACIAAMDVIYNFGHSSSSFDADTKLAFCNLKSLISNARPNNYGQDFPGYRYHDEELYFEENLSKEYFKKQNFDSTKRTDIINAMDCFLKKLKKIEPKLSIQPYYALIAFDLDGFGQKLQAINDQVTHMQLAKELAEFAVQVQENVEGTLIDNYISPELGRVLYAGGDDFLLAINMVNLFSALTKIADAFEQTVKSVPDLSYSTSVLISHYKAPLTRAVKTVRKNLKDVKTRFEHSGKNGVAFSFMMKSGAVTNTYFKQPQLDLLKRLKDALQDKLITPKFIFQYAQNMQEMGLLLVDTKQQEAVREFAHLELTRLMLRTSGESEPEDKTKQQIKSLAKDCKEMIDEQLLSLEELDLQTFLQFLKMAELTTKHSNQWQNNTSK